LLNLAEGAGRVSRNDKKHFYTIARGSLYECVAILDLVNEMELIDRSSFSDMYNEYEEASKMLLALYRNTSKSI
jgi:four helix bundle protein